MRFSLLSSCSVAPSLGLLKDASMVEGCLVIPFSSSGSSSLDEPEKEWALTPLILEALDPKF